MLRVELDTIDNNISLDGFSRKASGAMYAVVSTDEDHFSLSLGDIDDFKTWLDWVKSRMEGKNAVG